MDAGLVPGSVVDMKTRPAAQRNRGYGLLPGLCRIVKRANVAGCGTSQPAAAYRNSRGQAFPASRDARAYIPDAPGRSALRADRGTFRAFRGDYNRAGFGWTAEEAADPAARHRRTSQS
jgi:hypothetical protein